MSEEKVAPEDADYVCTLDEASLAKAIKELNEDPKNRLGAVNTFRTWILQQPHIKCPTDTRFLLAFLRARKFSQLESRRLLENYLRRREKMKAWFMDLDPANPKVQEFLDAGTVIVMPERDSDGRRVFVLRPGQVDPGRKGFKKDYAFKTIAMVLDWMYFTDENVQVNGTVTIIDFSNYSLKLQSAFSMEDRKNFIQTWQKNYPARIKELHMYNEGALVDFIMVLVKLAMSEKVQKRLKMHGQFMDSLYKHVPMNLLPEEYLPDEYEGPNPGPSRKITDGMKQSLMQPAIRSRLKFLSSPDFKIDMKEKPDDVPEASFRKLNVD